MRTTATMMFGVGETYAQRVEHMRVVRDLQDRTGGFTAWIPWTFQKENTELDGKVDEAGGFEYLKTLAVSRLFLDNVTHVQGSWVTQGPKIGHVSLSFGADDLGSIMIEENVVYAAGARNRMTQPEMRRIIEDAGYTPVQRRTLYDAWGLSPSRSRRSGCRCWAFLSTRASPPRRSRPPHPCPLPGRESGSDVPSLVGRAAERPAQIPS
jgi:2-iminoacetate synthase ThiH